jgi:hypothetical protein
VERLRKSGSLVTIEPPGMIHWPYVRSRTFSEYLPPICFSLVPCFGRPTDWLRFDRSSLDGRLYSQSYFFFFTTMNAPPGQSSTVTISVPNPVSPMVVGPLEGNEEEWIEELLEHDLPNTEPNRIIQGTIRTHPFRTW